MILLIAVLLAVPGASTSLEEVLTKMDAAGQAFKGLSAQVSYTKYTFVVKDKSVESGGIFMQKSGKGHYKVLIAFREPEKKTLLLDGNKVQIYREKINQLEEYAVGEHKAELEQFFQLGFGGGGHDLKNSYDITVGGEESVGGVSTVKLVLVPKGKLKDITQIELWLSKDKWEPVEQRFTEGASKDYTDILYQNLQDGPQGDNLFKIKTDGKTKKVFPGK